MATTTEVQTLKVVLDDANPQMIADALRKVALGTALEIIQTGATVIDVSQAKADTIVLDSAPLAVLSLSVQTAATGCDGSYVVLPAGSTAVARGAGAAAAGEVGAAVWDGDTTITFAASSDIQAAKVLVIPQPLSTSDIDFSVEFTTPS